MLHDATLLMGCTEFRTADTTDRSYVLMTLVINQLLCMQGDNTKDSFVNLDSVLV